MSLNFEWDESKSRSNQQKHGVSFEEAVTVFADSSALTIYDEGHSVTEDRFHTIGLSMFVRVLLVVHCERGSVIRIISARPATTKERRLYENQTDE